MFKLGRSPNLNPLDFYMWDYFKSDEYNPVSKALNDLKANITQEIHKINGKVLKSTKKILREINGGRI